MRTAGHFLLAAMAAIALGCSRNDREEDVERGIFKARIELSSDPGDFKLATTASGEFNVMTRDNATGKTAQTLGKLIETSLPTEFETVGPSVFFSVSIYTGLKPESHEALTYTITFFYDGKQVDRYSRTVDEADNDFHEIFMFDTRKNLKRQYWECDAPYNGPECETPYNGARPGPENPIRP